MTTLRPFSNGSQYSDWEGRNCGDCRKSWLNNQHLSESPCDIDNALTVAFWEDGTVSEQIAERMGLIANKGKYNWPCPEKESME